MSMHKTYNDEEPKEENFNEEEKTSSAPEEKPTSVDTGRIKGPHPFDPNYAIKQSGDPVASRITSAETTQDDNIDNISHGRIPFGKPAVNKTTVVTVGGASLSGYDFSEKLDTYEKTETVDSTAKFGFADNVVDFTVTKTLLVTGLWNLDVFRGTKKLEDSPLWQANIRNFLVAITTLEGTLGQDNFLVKSDWDRSLGQNDLEAKGMPASMHVLIQYLLLMHNTKLLLDKVSNFVSNYYDLRDKNKEFAPALAVMMKQIRAGKVLKLYNDLVTILQPYLYDAPEG